MCVLDVSVVHAPTASYRVAAADANGTWAARRNANQKSRLCTSQRCDDYDFVPFSVEMLRRLVASGTRFLTDMGTCVRRRWRRLYLAPAVCLPSAPKNNEALCHWNAEIEQTDVGYFPAGQAFMSGTAQSTAEVGAEGACSGSRTCSPDVAF
jgi:hypothetical protein